MAFRSLVIYATLITAVVQVIYGYSSTACYGTDRRCDFYSIDRCTSTQIIRLRVLYAGYKNTNLNQVCGIPSQHCSDPLKCCTIDQTSDVVEFLNEDNTYNTFTNCSGKQICTDMQVPRQQLQTRVNGATIYSSYVHVEYDCEEASKKIPFCGGYSGTNTFNYAEIMFDGSAEALNPSKASSKCQCNITNPGQQQNVIFVTIDVRLESHYKGENQTSANCSSAYFQSHVFSARCVQTDNHYQFNFHRENRQQTLVMGSGMTSEISLTDIHASGIQDAPNMVWISLQAEEIIKVTCEEVTKAIYSSTTTSTATTTSITAPKQTNTTATAAPKPKPTTTSTATTTSITAPKQTNTTATAAPKPKPTTTTTSKQTTTTPTQLTRTPPSTIKTAEMSPSNSPDTTPAAENGAPKQTNTTATAAPKPKPTTTTTSKQTTTTPTQLTRTPPSTIKTAEMSPSNSPDTTPAAENGESDSNGTAPVTLVLAICLPVIICLLFITSILLCLNMKRISSRKENAVNKDTRVSHVYDYVSDQHMESNRPIILQDGNQQQSSPMTVPEYQEIPLSTLSEDSAFEHNLQPDARCYNVPIQVTRDEHIYTPLQIESVQHITHIRLDQSRHVRTEDTLESGTRPEQKEADVEIEDRDTRQQCLYKKVEDTNGNVTSKVDYANSALVIKRSMNVNGFEENKSKKSESGSTTDYLTPISRDFSSDQL